MYSNNDIMCSNILLWNSKRQGLIFRNLAIYYGKLSTQTVHNAIYL